MGAGRYPRAPRAPAELEPRASRAQRRLRARRRRPPDSGLGPGDSDVQSDVAALARLRDAAMSGAPGRPAAAVDDEDARKVRPGDVGRCQRPPQDRATAAAHLKAPRRCRGGAKPQGGERRIPLPPIVSCPVAAEPFFELFTPKRRAPGVPPSRFAPRAPCSSRMPAEASTSSRPAGFRLGPIGVVEAGSSSASWALTRSRAMGRPRLGPVLSSSPRPSSAVLEGEPGPRRWPSAPHRGYLDANQRFASELLRKGKLSRRRDGALHHPRFATRRDGPGGGPARREARRPRPFLPERPPPGGAHGRDAPGPPTSPRGGPSELADAHDDLFKEVRESMSPACATPGRRSRSSPSPSSA